MNKHDEAVERLNQTEVELRDVAYEEQQYRRQKEDLLARLSQHDASVPAAEVERLRYLVGQCDLRIDTARIRKEYLQRRGSQEFDQSNVEQQLQPWLKPKKPKR